MPVADDVVWLDVLPSMKGFGPALVAGAKGPADKAGKETGRGFGKAVLAGTAVVAGGAALATKALYGIGQTFADVHTQIAADTGATGKNLDDLVGTAKRVGTEVPAGFDEIGRAVASVRSSISGFGKMTQDEMDRATVNALTFSKAFEIDMDRTTQVVGQMLKTGLIKDADEGFDLLTASAQKVPAALREDLLDAADEYGPFFKQLGLSGEQSMNALVAASDKGMYGIDKTGDALKEFTIRATDMSTASKAGYDLLGMSQEEMSAKLLKGGKTGAEAFQTIVGGLQDMEDPVAQSQAALALFGTPLEDLGTSEIPKFIKSLSGAKNVLGDVDGAAAKLGDTMNTGPAAEFQKFKNEALVTLEPVATRVFNVLGRGMKWVNTTGVPALKDMAKWMGENKTLMVVLGVAVGTTVAGMLIYKGTVVTVTAVTRAWNIAQKLLNGTMRLNPIGLVVTALALLAGSLVVAYKKSETFRRIVDGAWRGIKVGAEWAWKAIKLVFLAYTWHIRKVLAPAFMWLYKNVIKPVFGWIKSRIASAWEGGIKPAFNSIRTGVGKIGGAFEAARDKIGKSWAKVKSLVSGPIDYVIGIINKFIRAVNKIPGVELPLIGGGGRKDSKGTGPAKRTSGRTAYATGGPVFGAGTGTSDDIPALLSNNEHVWTAREVMKAGGHAAVERLRAMALRGRMAFAAGGRVVPGRGNRHSGYPWATWAGDFPVPTGTPVHAWKGGTVAMIKRLVTSYGNHIRMNHTDGTSSLYAHLSRIATSVGAKVKQGQVIGYTGSTGNSTGPHLHLETMGGPFKGGSGGGVGGAVKSIWDKVTGSVSGMASFVDKKISSILNVPAGKGGIFGVQGLQAMARAIGGQIKNGVKNKLFDDGGLANGVGYMPKNTIAPERVLSPRQTAAFEQAMSGVGSVTSTSERPIYMDGSIVAVLREVAGQEAEIVFNEGLASDNRYERMNR